jgi:hypothetical protein
MPAAGLFERWRSGPESGTSVGGRFSAGSGEVHLVASLRAG